jgi:hypothetical protein
MVEFVLLVILKQWDANIKNNQSNDTGPQPTGPTGPTGPPSGIRSKNEMACVVFHPGTILTSH